MGKKYLYMFHGTSSKKIRSILKKGLSADNATRVFDTSRRPSIQSFGGVYLTVAPSVAMRYAGYAVDKFGGNKAIIAVKVKVPSHSARMDEDELESAINFAYSTAVRKVIRVVPDSLYVADFFLGKDKEGVKAHKKKFFQVAYKQFLRTVKSCADSFKKHPNRKKLFWRALSLRAISDSYYTLSNNASNFYAAGVEFPKSLTSMSKSKLKQIADDTTRKFRQALLKLSDSLRDCLNKSLSDISPDEQLSGAWSKDYKNVVFDKVGFKGKSRRIVLVVELIGDYPDIDRTFKIHYIRDTEPLKLLIKAYKQHVSGPNVNIHITK